MEHRRFTALLSSLVLFSGVALAAEEKPRKPRQTRDRATEVVAELTEAGNKLEAKYAEQLSALKAGIEAALPQVDNAKQAALLAALEAEAAPAKEVRLKAREVRKIQAREANLRNLQEQLKYAPPMVVDAEARLKRALALPDDDEGKAEELKTARGKVKSRRKEADVLPGRIEQARAAVAQKDSDLAGAMKAYEAAVEAHCQAKTKTLKIMESLDAGRVIRGDTLDRKLAQYMILSEATPRFLAQFAQKGRAQEKLIEQLLADDELMIQMLVADGAYWEKYGQAMAIYTAIQKASPKAKDGLFQRLALAVSIEHAVPIAQRSAEAATDAREYVDPVQRYLSYEKWYLDGELDPSFKDHSVWEFRMVVDGKEPDEIFTWGRQMLRNYRPDLIPTDGKTSRYVDVVDAEIEYSSKNVKRDLPERHFFQNILANGGICGRRAFFGRFILRSFGVPTTRRKEPGHATLAHWSPDGWQTRLGGKWGGRDGVGRTQMNRYGRGLNFLANTQARENAAAFINVKRAQWIGALMGEQPVYGRIIPDQGRRTPILGFWHAVALTEQQRIIDGLDRKPSLAAAKTTVVSPPIELSEADRKITIDGQGVITIPGVACCDPTNSTKRLFKGRFREAVVFQKSRSEGTQLYLSRYARRSDTFEYTFEAPQAGKYHMTARAITPAPNQTLDVLVNGTEGIEMSLPYTVGLWGTTAPVEIELVKGENVLTFVGPSRVTIRDFTLAPAE